MADWKCTVWSGITLANLNIICESMRRIKWKCSNNVTFVSWRISVYTRSYIYIHPYSLFPAFTEWVACYSTMIAEIGEAFIFLKYNNIVVAIFHTHMNIFLQWVGSINSHPCSNKTTQVRSTFPSSTSSTSPIWDPILWRYFFYKSDRHIV